MILNNSNKANVCRFIAKSVGNFFLQQLFNYVLKHGMKQLLITVIIHVFVKALFAIFV